MATKQLVTAHDWLRNAVRHSGRTLLETMLTRLGDVVDADRIVAAFSAEMDADSFLEPYHDLQRQMADSKRTILSTDNQTKLRRATRILSAHHITWQIENRYALSVPSCKYEEACGLIGVQP